MKWLRLFLYFALFAIAFVYFYTKYGMEVTLLVGIGVLIGFVNQNVVLHDVHSRWLATSKNVPLWSVFVVVPVALWFIVPPVIQAGEGILKALGEVVSVQSCIVGGFLIVAVCVVLAAFAGRVRRS